jgi:hypothetical protein
VGPAAVALDARELMPDDWRHDLIERLLHAANDAGAWGYCAGSTGAAEPTALAALALTANECASEHVSAALGWLAGLQREDGAVPISAEAEAPYWPTSLVLLAWLRCAARNNEGYAVQVKKALGWLLEARGQKVPPDPNLHDHDTTLVGWSWVAGTHSWIEPTAYALLALRAAGQTQHARTRAGVELILDRALPAGGWNYGNRRVLEHVLRPFPATTGVALAALAGERRETRIDAAIDYLANELARIRAPLSLAWGLIGLRGWNVQPPEAQTWLSECAQRLIAQPAHPLYDALVLLAGAPRCPLIKTVEVRSDD